MAFVKKIQLEGVNYDIADAAAARASAIADVENGTTASKAYLTGDYLYRNDILYKVISDISLGDSFVVDTNIEATNVMSETGNVPIATTSVAGIVKPDGTSILVDANGVISASADMSDYIEKSATEGLIMNDGSIDTSKHVHLKPTGKELTGDLQTKTWSGLTSFYSNYIWTDGEYIYYSSGSNQYVLDKSTSTWSTKTWSGFSNIYGNSVWTDGDNIYYSYSGSNYILNKSTSTWNTKTWSGYSNFDGTDIWTDGDNIYYSYSGKQYVLDKSTSTWSEKTWTGLTTFNGAKIWTDGDNVYHSNVEYHYVLDKSTSTWSIKVWNGLTEFSGNYIWTDGNNIYYSLNSDQYVLDKSTSTWSTKTWTGLTSFTGNYIWTDEDNIYYSSASNQYVFISEAIYADGYVKSDGTIDTTDISGKADKVTNATSDNFAKLDANGNLADSGYSANSFMRNIYLEQTVTLSTSAATTVTFTDSSITTTSVIDLAVSEWGLTPDDVTVTEGVCTVTMPKVDSAHSVIVRIYVR